MEIICLETEAFHSLVKEVVNRIKEDEKIEHDKWISTDDAMKLLNISSKTTLQKYRDEGEIRFSQPSKKHIVYDRASILEFLDRHSHDTF